MVALLACTVAMVVFHYGFHADALVRRGVGQRRAMLVQRMAGAVLLGVVPLAALVGGCGATRAELGLGRPDLRGTLGFFAAVCVLVAPVVARAQSRPEAWAHTPQIRETRWNAGLFVENALTWAVYLFGYELMFRGVLLFTLTGRVGPWLAVALTTALYVFAHLPKPAPETVGTIPMGAVFAWSSLLTGSIWAPFLAHLAVALTSDMAAVRSNPGITVRDQPPRD